MSSNRMSKVKKYIVDDRPRRLRTYMKKHHLDLSTISLSKGRNLQHYCCKYGSGAMMKYLISEGVDCLDIDSSSNTPLHVALLRALSSEESGKQALTTECYTEIILPMIQRFPGSLDMRNKAGNTCRHLLQLLVQRREPASQYQESSPHCDTDSGPSETAWRDKLADEWQHEYSTTWGKYEHDFTSFEAESEAYEDWADRIRDEYHARKQANAQWHQSTQSSKRKSKRKHSDTDQHANEGLETARAKMRKRFDENKQIDLEMNKLKKRMKYEQRYKQLLESGSSLTLLLGFDDVPWPSVKGEEYDITVLFDGMDKSGQEYRKYLRDQQIRWHPDKFLQRFGRYLDSKEKEKIVKRVTVLSQNLNKLVT